MPIRFSKWMRTAGLTDDTLAPLVNADRTTISRIRRGKQKPSWDLIARFKDVSGGKVTADSFLEPDSDDDAEEAPPMREAGGMA